MPNFEFLPLYLIAHDQWGYQIPHVSPWGTTYENFPHYGHTHFFMPGFDYAKASRRAWTGEQLYKFKLADVWSPRTEDPNQTKNIVFEGLPEWYFLVREYWRRVYIQPWDSGGGKGIKYDASASFHTHGPWREARGSFFYWNDCARTLPLEYFKNPERTSRDNLVGLSAGEGLWDLPGREYDAEASYPIPTQFWAPDSQANARVQAWSDFRYAGPTIEYQRVDQLNWERPPERAGTEGGDGFEIELSLPLKSAAGEILSPFSSSSDNCSPFGVYCNGFADRHPGRIPVYPSANPSPETSSKAVYDVPSGFLGQPVVWRVPEALEPSMDGVWVEQFLGGVVKAAALVRYVDNFGGRHEQWVKDSHFRVSDAFVGKDST
ncbi:MAG: hypothetical protein WC932_06110 [archaeon]|jgi:hypothetical protein